MAKPICLGSGLVALDIILQGKENTPLVLNAGGSTGNVLTILAYLGWNSKLVSRLSNDKASSHLISDLDKWGVDCEFISTEKDGNTPLIIHRILVDKIGKPKHRFEFKDPLDKKWLPQYKPVLASTILEMEEVKTKVFYFDRANRGTIELAHRSKKNDALIVFEPSSIGELRLFKECLDVADIVKFSGDRIKGYDEAIGKQFAPLEIHTKGTAGLEFRFGKTKKISKWTHLPAIMLDEKYILDSAGAGDWCSAAIINELGKNGSVAFNQLKISEIIDALKVGQAYAAINCCFNGARGLMYNISKLTFNKLVNHLINGDIVQFEMIMDNPRIFSDGNTKVKLTISSLYR